ncbi:hypothetical protein ACTQ49_11750 [Luteococcus sp. Sow4_B9]|uniref:hypothetical protein n=1 Tax=Luteococcus sp. Sow4_B9 TaxID=3438792 RepID=UPI003F96BC6E
MFNALRDRALSLPDDPTTREQFATTRLVETAPGVVKLSNPLGHHDDIVTAVGMVCVDLAGTSGAGGGISRPAGRRLPADRTRALAAGLAATLPTTTANGRRAVGLSSTGAPSPWLLSKAAKASPRGLPGGGPIVGVPGAHDDPRRGQAQGLGQGSGGRA